MPTIQEKNIVIAEMLGWKDMDGDFVLPKNLESNYDYREWCGTKEYENPDIFPGFMESHYILSPNNLMFRNDANWQYEAIDWIEKQGYVTNRLGKPDSCTCIIRSLDLDSGLIAASTRTGRDIDRKKVVFEALWQFSQYLKEKK